MKIQLVMACDLAGNIGIDNTLPWPTLKRDMDWFREKTLGKVLLMGNSTFKGMAPLKDRFTLVLTKNKTVCGEKPLCLDNKHAYHANEDARYVSSIKRAENITKCMGVNDLIVAGGLSLYEQVLSRAGIIHLTVILREYATSTNKNVVNAKSLLENIECCEYNVIDHRSSCVYASSYKDIWDYMDGEYEHRWRKSQPDYAKEEKEWIFKYPPMVFLSIHRKEKKIVIDRRSDSAWEF